MTSSGRRVKRRNLDECDGAAISRTQKKRRSRHGRLGSRKKLAKSKAVRPQRRSARNALTFLSKLAVGSSDEEDDAELESCSSESESDFPDSNSQSIESERLMLSNGMRHPSVKDAFVGEHEDAIGLSRPAGVLPNTGTRKLVLKFPCRESRAITSLGIARSECREQEAKVDLFSRPCHEANLKNGHFGPFKPAQSSGDADDAKLYENVIVTERGAAEKQKNHLLSAGCSSGDIKWGEVKTRSSKRLKLGDSSVADLWVSPNSVPSSPHLIPIATNGLIKSEDEHRASSIAGNHAPGNNLEINRGKWLNDAFQGLNAGGTDEHASGSIFVSTVSQKLPSNADQQDWHVKSAMDDMSVSDNACMDKGTRGIGDDRGISDPVNGYQKSDNRDISKDASHNQELERNPLKFKIRSSGLGKENSNTSSKLKSAAIEDSKSFEHSLVSDTFPPAEQNSMSTLPEEDESTSGQSLDHSDWKDEVSGSLGTWADESHHVKKPHLGSNTKMYNVVYKRSKLSRGRQISDSDTCGIEGSSSNVNSQSDAQIDGIRRTRSMGSKVKRDESPLISNSRGKERYGSSKASRIRTDLSMNDRENHNVDEWMPTSRTVGLRSARSRRENYNSNLGPLNNSRYQQTGRKLSWLTLMEHEVSYRYIPQLGDEVAYLRQVRNIIEIIIFFTETIRYMCLLRILVLGKG